MMSFAELGSAESEGNELLEKRGLEKLAQQRTQDVAVPQETIEPLPWQHRFGVAPGGVGTATSNGHLFTLSIFHLIDHLYRKMKLSSA